MNPIPLTTCVLGFLLCVSSVAAHDEFVLDSRRATPGPRLDLIAVPPSSGQAAHKYRLRIQPGLPSNVLFRVLTKDFGHGFHTIASGFQLDESGNLVTTEAVVSAQPLRLEEIVLDPGPYPRGAAWEVALVSADRAIRLFAKTIPYPISARDGTCAVSLELVSQRGDRFLALGSGFIPGDEVSIESRYSGRVVQKRKQVSHEGMLPPDSLAHKAPGVDLIARYTVKGQSCEVVVDYQWGEQALTRR